MKKLELVILALLLVCSSLAQPLTYDISYDPNSNIATLANLASSSTELEFWTLAGFYEGTALYLEPGGSVTVDAYGNIIGSGWSSDAVVVKNKFAPADMTITWGSSAGPGSILVGQTGNYPITAGQGSGNNPVIVPTGYHFSISTDGDPTEIYGFADAEFSPTTGYVSGWLCGPDWVGNPAQANIELGSGGLVVSDDISSATSIQIDGILYTECPEPSGLALLIVGTLAVTMQLKIDI